MRTDFNFGHATRPGLQFSIDFDKKVPPMKRPTYSLTDQRFGKLITGEFSHYEGTHAHWHVTCDCGTKKTSNGTDLRLGKINSCGCGLVGRGFRHGGRYTPEYTIWCAMKDRCENPQNKSFPYYGGRGIKVCKQWQSFDNFLRDMGKRPRGKSIDRFPNNNGNYEPGNCRWATTDEQARNTRANVLITYQGQTRTAQEWATITGIDNSTICKRVKAGWAASDILRRPSYAPRA